MSKTRRVGLRREPADGWPLDRLFVGVATLRTTRELFLLDRWQPGAPQRPWDVALWSGVSPQGSADSLERLHRLGLVRMVSLGRAGRAAPWYRLQGSYPLFEPLARLFEAERALKPPANR